MTPTTSLLQQEEHLFSVLSGKRFLQMEGLSNEVPFFIYPYDPEVALDGSQLPRSGSRTGCQTRA